MFDPKITVSLHYRLGLLPACLLTTRTTSATTDIQPTTDNQHITVRLHSSSVSSHSCLNAHAHLPRPRACPQPPGQRPSSRVVGVESPTVLRLQAEVEVLLLRRRELRARDRHRLLLLAVALLLVAGCIMCMPRGGCIMCMPAGWQTFLAEFYSGVRGAVNLFSVYSSG